MQWSISDNGRHVRGCIAPGESDGALSRWRSLGQECFRAGVTKVLVVSDGSGDPTSTWAIRHSIQAMALAGLPSNFSIALVARTAHACRIYKYAEAVAERRNMRVKVFFNEVEAVRWLENYEPVVDEAAQEPESSSYYSI